MTMTKELNYIAQISEILEWDANCPNPEAPGTWEWETWERVQKEWQQAELEACEREFHHTYNPELD
jgi:hypothetical protein